MASDKLTQRAMVIGQVLHEGTGLPVAGTVTITSAEGDVVMSLRPDGRFAISGRPDILFPKLATTPATFHLAIHADSDQFRAGFADAAKNVPLAAGETFDPPIDIGVIELPADTVYIRGGVHSGVDPMPAVSGATVDLMQGVAVIASTVTVADGSYAFDNVMAPPPVSLRCTAATFQTQTQALTIDYGAAVNELYFRMTPS